MNKLLTLYLLLQTSISFAQTETFQDLVNHTVVYYTSTDVEISNPNLDLLEEATYIELKDDQWPGAKKVNALIRNQVNELKTADFAAHFKREYNKALKNTLVDWYNSCVEESDDPQNNDCGRYSDFARYFTPDNVHADFFITTLCDHILIGGMNISFTAAHEEDELSLEDLAFQDLHYYDLLTGEEIDPATILDSRKMKEFHKLIKSRVPEHLKQLADTLDLTKGLPIFNGGSFYYFLEGNVEIYSEHQSILQVRLSIEEVLPFLNPKGPFKAYSAIKTGNTAYSGLIHDEAHHSGVHRLEEAESFRTIERLIDHLSGQNYANKTVYIHPERSLNETQIVFNKQGQPVTRKVITPDAPFSDDSVAYAYHPNGKLKSMHSYELETIGDDNNERDVFVLVKSLVFDQQQNLIEKSAYKTFPFDPIEVEVNNEYYTYINDRVIADGSFGMRIASAHEGGATEYLIHEGASLFFQKFDRVPNDGKYTTRQSGDTTFIEFTSNRGTEIYASYIEKNNQLTEFTEQNGNGQTKITYDQSNQPIQYSFFKRSASGYVPYIAASMEYDSNNRLVKYTYQFLNGNKNINLPEVYLFRYE